MKNILNFLLLIFISNLTSQERRIIEVKRFDKGSVRSSVDGLEIGLPLEGIIDFATEVSRLNKEIISIDKEITKISAKLDNKSFLAKAPIHVVDDNKRRLSEETTRKKVLEAALNRITYAK